MSTVKFNWEGIDQQLAEFKFAVAGAVRPAAQAGAQVYYDEVKTRAGAIKASGTLAASIYQKYSSEMSTEGVRATYYISWNKGKVKGTQTKAAFHGQLIEYGWLQRYASYLDTDGQWHTAIRPEKQDTPKPKRNASQAVKDAYYVLRKGGPIQHAPRSFLRSSYEAKKDEALQTAMRVFYDRLLSASV
jgi:hypothetical protein